MSTEQGVKKLEEVAKRMKAETSVQARPSPERVTAREFIAWFGFKRRSQWLVSLVRNKMEELGLRTVPDFERLWIDAEISIELVTTGAPKPRQVPMTRQSVSGCLRQPTKSPSA